MPHSALEARNDVTLAWLHAVKAWCDGLRSNAATAPVTELARIADAFLRRFPRPSSTAEMRLKKALLLDLALHLGQKLHHRFHSAHHTAMPRCGFVAAGLLEAWVSDAGNGGATAFRRWAARYVLEFQAAHPQVVADGAAHYIREHYRTPISVPTMARHLRCSPASMQRRFKQATGLTLREYQSDLRAREALRLLHRRHDLTIETVARDVGYRSKKGLYRVVEERTGRTPLEFRRRGARMGGATANPR